MLLTKNFSLNLCNYELLQDASQVLRREDKRECVSIKERDPHTKQRKLPHTL